MPVGGSDYGTIPPAGTRLDLQNVWIDGAYTVRSGGTLTVTGTTGLTTQSINGTGTAPTIAAVAAGAGTGSTITAQKGHDLGGSFVLTAAGTPAAGPVATVTFGTALPAAPVSVIVTAVDTTGSPILAINMGAGAFSATGFSIASVLLTAAHTYLVSYQVVAS